MNGHMDESPRLRALLYVRAKEHSRQSGKCRLSEFKRAGGLNQSHKEYIERKIKLLDEAYTAAAKV